MKTTRTTPLHIAVPTPCHEDWQKMTPDEQGRHCASCQKVVTDFTTMTDQQLIDFLSQGKGSGCGRFRQDQLTRALYPTPKERLWKFPRFIAASVVSVFTSLGSLFASIPGKTLPETIQTEPVHGGIRLDPNMLVKRTISGVVMDGLKPLEGVQVSIPALPSDTFTTDLKGRFSFEVDVPISADDLLLVFVKEGYGAPSYNIRSFENGTTVEMNRVIEIEVLPPKAMITGEVIMGIPAIEPEIIVNPRIEPGKEKAYDAND